MRTDSFKKDEVPNLVSKLETKDKELKKLKDKLKETEEELNHKNDLLECYTTKDKLEEQHLGYPSIRNIREHMYE